VNVLDRPRKELRRVVHGGRVHGCQVDGDRLILDDGRSIAEAGAAYAPPVTPTTIVCVHLNYRSRAVEFGVDLAEGHPTYFVKPATSVNSHRG
jgi:5-oxopent-3-ene-1,2,5-tricarboxylate decarboxylase / 2-hydroxyhepta-2,4-diene-1,7-dioate isomerase